MLKSPFHLSLRWINLYNKLLVILLLSPELVPLLSVDKCGVLCFSRKVVVATISLSSLPLVSLCTVKVWIFHGGVHEFIILRNIVLKVTYFISVFHMKDQSIFMCADRNGTCYLVEFYMVFLLFINLFLVIYSFKIMIQVLFYGSLMQWLMCCQMRQI